MPLADFSGRRDWGYDGVLWYAPDSAYGRPEDLKTLIDEAHLRGLMVFLDVVYNHFGPEGNFLGRYAPNFFTDAHTPWGSAIDYRVPRGARFRDRERAATGCATIASTGCGSTPSNHICPSPASHRCCTISASPAGELATATGRHIHLVLENGDNRASLLDAAQEPPRGKYRAQWNDDYHHAWHVMLTGEAARLLRRLSALAARGLARALAPALSIRARLRAFWGDKPRGEPSGKLPPATFVNFLQNHDQIGNRPFGDRLESARARAGDRSRARGHAARARCIPMLFMGEEWGSKAPFPFFCDFEGDLAEAVRNGRQAGIQMGL